MRVVENTCLTRKVKVKALYAECFDENGRLDTIVHMLEPARQLERGDSLTITWTLTVE